jgi:DNA repair exonuclease SbcCD ATPase subunit
MRQALANIGGAGNNIKHMFIDEGFTACDSVNIEKAHDMMKKLVELGGFRSILIVSHLDVIQESIPLKIKVQRDGSFSKLCFGLKRQAPRQAT